MNKQICNYSIWAIALIVLLAGCVSMAELDTNNKRLLAAETSLQELSLFALNSKDRMDVDTKQHVKDLINDSHTAIRAARVALAINDTGAFDSNLSTVSALLAALRPILIELEE